MGEYERTYERISELERRIKEIDKEIDELSERRWELEVEVGENYGYIAELNSIDGEW